MSGRCVRTSGASCGDGSITECANPDTCDDFGACLDNHKDAGTLCGDTGTECIAQDVCNGDAGPGLGNGVCEDQGLLPGYLVNNGGCPIDELPAKDGRDFKLFFTPELDIWVACKLSSSNPGQMCYTLAS